ncbi:MULTISPECIES: TlpA disulfide reductase family protein [Chryseobacterium]|uniref:Thiol-disulfide oxidoreductase ResA n=1 Tax=Chryseobacterium salivictor TaxID=2547600 RepID=A0A4P6ZH30_9FLAO|nr:MULTISPECIES: TlpA disulfide reductase family protein [Chryseobacterium]MDQ0475604.1 thiol-disulfide isomerase/thioredoxin [Chryseobacterium sp. MDT2-18]QBO59031.1 Thiol-disulfide oxidoreductase ResA [Chryseobacterium salivictor]
MKKLILGVVLCTALSACKKEAKVNETTDTTVTDSAGADHSAAATETAFPFKHVELSAEESTKLLGKKDNDTLYVTNFFATWCGPCMREIPHFKEKMAELKSQPVKFTFVSLDEKGDWDTKVKKFSEEQGLSQNVVLLDGSLLTPEFFKANFKEWDGGSIPFTFMRKGDKTDETVGMMSAEALTEKINSFK